MFTNFQLRKVYNFDMFNPALLGTSYKGATVLGIMDFESAMREADVQSTHINTYSYLPPGTPNDPRQYDYVRIKTTTGQILVLGMAWIKGETVTVVDSRIITVKIFNVTAGDLPKVRDALVQNGFNNPEITISV